ncbi:MAG TPA: PepSY domain-containing protein [Burkholderiales bacterium]|nr:PepSY domain-containing protein [Burkholderiales bacterium]
MKRRLLYVTAAAAIAALGSAYAARDGESETALLAQAKISLGQAIASAEQHAKGRAVRAELENENGTAVYGVEVVDGTKATDVKVDARDGKVLSAQADRGDEGADDEHEGESAHEGRE